MLGARANTTPLSSIGALRVRVSCWKSKPPIERPSEVLRSEIVLWQKVVNPKGLVGLLTREIPKEYKTMGRWMLDALELRDQWQSRLLRTTSWSPWF